MLGLLLISNGYGEDFFASILLEHLMTITKQEGMNLPVYIVPLVGTGKAFLPLIAAHPASVFLLFQPAELPYGGMYRGSTVERIVRLGKELWSWRKKDLGDLSRTLCTIRSRIHCLVGVGDAIPPLINAFYFRKKLFQVAVAHSSLLKKTMNPFERIGRVTAFLFRTYCTRVYTRDSHTARWFQTIGIPASYLGFLAPDITVSPSVDNTVLLLPGSRLDWKDNFIFIHHTLTLLPVTTANRFHFHWVFAPSHPQTDIEELMVKVDQRGRTWSQGDYPQRLGQSSLVFGFAGTALEQAAFLGIPSVGPFRSDAAVNRDFVFNRQTLLLREAFLCSGNTPRDSAQILDHALSELPEFRQKARQFSQSTWEGINNGGLNIARDIFSTIRQELL